MYGCDVADDEQRLQAPRATLLSSPCKYFALYSFVPFALLCTISIELFMAFFPSHLSPHHQLTELSLPNNYSNLNNPIDPPDALSFFKIPRHGLLYPFTDHCVS